MNFYQVDYSLDSGYYKASATVVAASEEQAVALIAKRHNCLLGSRLKVSAIIAIPAEAGILWVPGGRE